MAKYTLTKAIECRKLNKRTMVALPQPPQLLPYGAILLDATEKGERLVFQYLGEPYDCLLYDIQSAIKPVE